MPDSPVPTSLREQLRAATAVAHARVDALMAHGLPCRADYHAYLSGMQAFVAGVAPPIAPHAAAWGWQLADWNGWLARDLDAVSSDPARLDTDALDVPDAESALGALYVIEGSALGARSLLRQAQALGYGADRGAESLHAHAAGEGGRRWSRFLALLEERGAGLERSRTCGGAVQAFELAERCFRRARRVTA